MNFSSILRTAHALIRAAHAANWSQALRLAWRKAKIAAALRNGWTAFTYRKKDGTIRQAVGTLDAMLFAYHSKEGSSAHPHTLTYFDKAAGGFRCFLINNFIEFTHE